MDRVVMSFFSIIMPSYNRAHLISKGIKSVIDQSYKNWELMIVDDGSNDNTKDVVASFKDVRIKYIYQENAERSAARNNGINHASGEWICFLDSDDYYLPNHLETFNIFIDENHVPPSFIVTGGLEERNGELKKKVIFNTSSGMHPASFIFANTCLTPISVCIHKSCFDEHRFLEKYKKAYWEDTHLWIRLALSFPFFQLEAYTNVLAEHKERSVNSQLSLHRVEDHIEMINDLFSEHKYLLNGVFNPMDRISYIDRKYRMFLYISRQNKQLNTSLQIWFKGMRNQPSWYLLSEWPKIFINKLGFGIHGR
jgi:glycosyltransferase involved in cell wall biosynthesis